MVAIAGLSVLIGLSGQISLGNGAFMAIGAYAAALLMLHLNWPLWAVFPASAAIAAVAGRGGGRGRGPAVAAPTWPVPPSCWRWPCRRWRSSSPACSAATRG